MSNLQQLVTWRTMSLHTHPSEDFEVTAKTEAATSLIEAVVNGANALSPAGALNLLTLGLLAGLVVVVIVVLGPKRQPRYALGLA